jgi:hypothetical protein
MFFMNSNSHPAATNTNFMLSLSFMSSTTSIFPLYSAAKNIDILFDYSLSNLDRKLLSLLYPFSVSYHSGYEFHCLCLVLLDSYKSCFIEALGVGADVGAFGLRSLNSFYNFLAIVLRRHVA